MKKFITAFAIAASMVPAAFAGQRGAHASAAHAGLRHHAGGKIFAQLNLSDEQKAQIKAIHEADRQANKALYDSFRTKAAEYRALRKANDPRAAEAKAALQPLADQMKAARQATHEKVLALLTPEQREQLPKLTAGARGFARGFAAGRRAGMLGQLNLTDEQKQQIKALRQSDREQNKALFQSFHAKASEYRELKKANDPKADALRTDLQALHTQIRDARKAGHEKILALLTPEQRSKIEQFRSQRGRG